MDCHGVGTLEMGVGIKKAEKDEESDRYGQVEKPRIAASGGNGMQWGVAGNG